MARRQRRAKMPWQAKPFFGGKRPPGFFIPVATTPEWVPEAPDGQLATGCFKFAEDLFFAAPSLLAAEDVVSDPELIVPESGLETEFGGDPVAIIGESAAILMQQSGTIVIVGPFLNGNNGRIILSANTLDDSHRLYSVQTIYDIGQTKYAVYVDRFDDTGYLDLTTAYINGTGGSIDRIALSYSPTRTVLCVNGGTPVVSTNEVPAAAPVQVLIGSTGGPVGIAPIVQTIERYPFQSDANTQALSSVA